MKSSSTNRESQLKHDLKNLLLQVEGALKLLEMTKDEAVLDEIQTEIMESVSGFIEKQKAKQ